jgi:hypothetical protein
MVYRLLLIFTYFSCSTCWAVEKFDVLASATTKLKQRYPMESFISMQVADEAIAESLRLQSKLDEWFFENEAACYRVFFVNSCLQDVKGLRRQLLPELKGVEFVAKDFKRQSKVFAGDQKNASDQLK